MTSTYPSAQDSGKELLRRREEFTDEIISAYRSCSWAELALRRQGWTPERLHLAARKITNDYVAGNIPYLSPDRRDDLCDFVLEKALQATLRFKPEHPTTTYGANGGIHFDSWICDIMWHRCPDWMRSKAEGNGDKRYGNDNRVDLSDDPDPADHDSDFHTLVDDRRRSRWQQAAVNVGWELDEWICITLDKAATQVELSAA